MGYIPEFFLPPEIENNITMPDTHDNAASSNTVLGPVEDHYTQTLLTICRLLDESQAIRCEEQEKLQKAVVEAQDEQKQLRQALMDAEMEVETLNKELRDSKAELQSLKSLMSSVAQKLSQGTARD